MTKVRAHTALVNPEEYLHLVAYELARTRGFNSNLRALNSLTIDTSRPTVNSWLASLGVRRQILRLTPRCPPSDYHLETLIEKYNYPLPLGPSRGLWSQME